MSSNDVLRRSIRYILFANAAAAAAGSTVAVAADTDTAEPVLQEVIVTGTRISQPGLASIAPVTTVTSAEIKTEGVTRIEDLLNNLPQVFADQGSNISNGATGEATVNLRGLGSQRTLVLINGRRLMPGDPTVSGNATPDLNQIPAALVERVDVLTGGASSVYGADAVSGVVNFVMNDHFEGVRIDANTSMYNHHQHQSTIQNDVTASNFALPGNVNDGKAKDVTVMLGGNFADGKGNLTAYASYRRIDPISEAARDFSACTLAGSNVGTYSCGGSHTSATGGFLFSNGNLLGNPYATVGPGGQLVPFSQGPGEYNYAPTNYYQRSDERYTAGLFGHYDFNEHVTAYSEFMFMTDDTNAQVAPSGAFLGSGTGVGATGIPDGSWLVNCNNPLLSAQEAGILCAGQGPTDTAHVIFGRRNIEGGPRNNDLTHTSFRMVEGTRGEIAEGWKFDAYVMFGKTLYDNYYTNDVSKSRLTNALQVVNDPVTGQPVCKANVGGAGAPGCVPYNIWTNGQVSPAAVDYISVPSILTGSTDERVISGSVTGDLTHYGVKTPWAETGLGIAVGAEYRQEKMTLRPDVENLTNDLAGTGNPVLPLNAGLQVKEVFMEARLPILQDLPFAKLMSFETGYRYSDYDLGFKTNTYKFGVDFAPTSDVRVRAGYNRAVRAPNLQELFQEKFVGNDGATDPCATSSGSPPTATPAQCARTGVSAAQYGKVVGNSAGQYNGQFAGSATLKPEVSDTKTLGLVITPRFLPAMSMTVDYYDIRIKNIISTIGYSTIMTDCLNRDLLCNLINRAPGTGSLWLSPNGYITDNTLNLGSETSKGVDVAANYRLDAGKGGNLTFAFNGTYTDQLIFEPVAGLGSYNCAGLYGNTCGTPTPKWRHKLRTTWETPLEGLDVSLQWRHIASVLVDTTSGNPQLNGTSPTTDTKLGSREYLDLSVAYQVAKGLTARIGVNNMLDKDPPIAPGTDFGGNALNNGNTFPQVYDTLGRYMFLNITADF